VFSYLYLNTPPSPISTLFPYTTLFRSLYHSYDGGGIQIKGPSILLRKSLGENTAISYNFYIDSITSASVDVLTYGSPYTEKRTENDLSVEYLDDNTILSLGVANSVENDYDANTVFFGVSHEMFSALTTVSLGYSAGSDTVRKRNSPNFIESLSRHNYKFDISQIITKSIVLNLGFETITEEGYLQNPYRGIVTFSSNSPTELLSLSGENYPNTRTSNAVALRGMYYLPFRAKLYGELRGFSDSWDITASMWMVGYTQPIGNKLIFDVHHRVYSQTQASFFSDLFDSDNPKEFQGRDKELDAMTSVTSGVAIHYQSFNRPWWIFDKGNLNVPLDRARFESKNYISFCGGYYPM